MAGDDQQPGQAEKPALPNGVHTGDPVVDGDALSQLDQLRDRVASAASQMKGLFNAIRAPLPTQTGDGSQLPQKESKSLGSDIKTVLQDINKLGFDRVEDLAYVIKKSKLGQPLDDKKYYMVSYDEIVATRKLCTGSVVLDRACEYLDRDDASRLLLSRTEAIHH